MALVRALPIDVSSVIDDNRPGEACGRDFEDWGLHQGANFFGVHKDFYIDFTDGNKQKQSTCVNVGKQMCVKAGGVGETVDLVVSQFLCPKCKEPFELQNIYFYNCKFVTKYKYWVEAGGIQKLYPGDGDPCVSESSTQDGKFSKFKESEAIKYPVLTVTLSSK